MATIDEIRDSFLKPLEGVVSSLDGGEFTPDFNGLGFSVGAVIGISARDSLDVMFYSDGTARIVIKSGLQGVDDEVNSWRLIAEKLLLLVDYYGRAASLQVQSYQQIVYLRRFAATL